MMLGKISPLKITYSVLYVLKIAYCSLVHLFIIIEPLVKVNRAENEFLPATTDSKEYMRSFSLKIKETPYVKNRNLYQIPFAITEVFKKMSLLLSTSP